MCGICGIAHAGTAAEVSEERLRRMREALSHRGPDGHGEHTFGGVGLAHTRLSIIDVAGGAQPLSNEDGSVWITYNGEIYNYIELMEQLRSRGHAFRTRSDTEVLVHLYEERGPDLVHALNGMFAFAIHDVRRQRVLLARDPFGIKPLYYAVQDGVLFFGSEIKSILAAIGQSPRTTTRAVQEYLTFRCCAGDRTFFDGVHRLPPGSIAVWERGTLTVRTYWTPPLPKRPTVDSVESAATELEAHLERSVRAQLMSEVPLGTFCSGGVDSGLTSWYAARASSHRLHTFSVGFRDPVWDESALARETAQRVGSEHHILVADPGDYHDALPRLIWSHDEPLAHPNSVLIALLSAFARRTVTVALTGEGSDEFFGGYPRHHIVRLNALAGRWPDWMRRRGASVLRRFGSRRARMVGEHLPVPFPEAVVFNTAFVSPTQVERLTGSTPDAVIGARIATAESLSVPGDPVASIGRYDQATYLPCLLDRMDRMSMASGLEARVPFLDTELADWVSGVPSSYRLGLLSNKRVVKHLATRYLSPSVTSGRKSGFGVPVGDWLRMPSWSDYVERLRDTRHPATAMIDSREVGRILDAHLEGQPGFDDTLWLLLNLYLWHEIDVWTPQPEHAFTSVA